MSREANVRQRSFEFLKWTRDEAGLCPKSGDETWNAVDVISGDKVVARVFPKQAHRFYSDLIRIYNRHSYNARVGRITQRQLNWAANAIADLIASMS